MFLLSCTIIITHVQHFNTESHYSVWCHWCSGSTHHHCTFYHETPLLQYSHKVKAKRLLLLLLFFFFVVSLRNHKISQSQEMGIYCTRLPCWTTKTI